MGVPELLGGLVVLGVVVLVAKARRSQSVQSRVVLTRFSLTTAPPCVVIQGRTPGVLGWLLTQLKVGSLTTFSVSEREVRLDYKSMNGGTVLLLPGKSVSAVRAQYQSPIWALIFMGAVIGLSSLTLFMMSVSGADVDQALGMICFWNFVVVLLCCLLFIFGKKCVLEVDTDASKGPGLKVGISFSPSVLDGVSINLEQLTTAAELINEKVAQQVSA